MTLCRNCGHQLVAAAAVDATEAPATAQQRASTLDRPWDEIPLTPTSTWHRVPEPGVQSYVVPAADGALAQFVPGGAKVGLVTTEGAWAKVLVGGTTTWVDGRVLLPPTAGGAPAASRTASKTSSSKSIPVHNTWSLVCAAAGVGVLVGAILPWFSAPGGINSFDFPLQFLFSSSIETLLESREPRVGYFLGLFGVVAILTAFRDDAIWVRRFMGVLTVAIALLYCYQLQNSISGPFSSNRDFFDVVGIGPFIVGICGLALAVLPGPSRF